MGDTKIKNAESYQDFPAYFSDMRTLAAQYGNMPIESVYSAYVRAAMATNPYMQNRRVKAVSSMPADYGKDQIAEMIKAPDGNERALRQTMHALEWSAYPVFKIRKTYQDLNTDRYYFYPAYLEESDAKSDAFWREGKLLDQFNFEFKPEQLAHQARGQAVQEGKVAYVPRYSIDKAHNKVNYAFWQQLPSDWWKPVGFNNVSKYTVMFNMMYFMQPGADWRQFGNLFVPYLNDFTSVLDSEYDSTMRPGTGSKYVYASKNTIRAANGSTFHVNMQKFSELREDAAGNPQIYNQNGRWAYWVTLPIDKVWVFEIDDANRTAVTPLTGLFLAMDQLSAYEAAQLEIVQNPLVSVALGEIPYFSDKNSERGEPDRYQLSPTGRAMFQAYWYQMCQESNTGGIGAYFAPVNHLHLETLQEAPNATKISTAGYQYAVSKSGLSGLIPINDNPRAGSVNTSVSLEERFCITVYTQMENMMNTIYKGFGLNFTWRFRIFGGMQADEKDLKTAKDGMASGILSEVFRWYALRGISIFSDLAMSRMIKSSGVLDLRIPLVSAYNVSRKDGTLPPQPGNEGGRPPIDVGEIESEGTEDALDAGD